MLVRAPSSGSGATTPGARTTDPTPLAHILITIPASHYCERARWALDYAGIPYSEQQWPPLLHWQALKGLTAAPPRGNGSGVGSGGGGPGGGEGGGQEAQGLMGARPHTLRTVPVLRVLAPGSGAHHALLLADSRDIVSYAQQHVAALWRAQAEARALARRQEEGGKPCEGPQGATGGGGIPQDARPLAVPGRVGAADFEIPVHVLEALPGDEEQQQQPVPAAAAAPASQGGARAVAEVSGVTPSTPAAAAPPCSHVPPSGRTSSATLPAPLYPDDPSERAAVLRLEALFADRLGVWARVVAYWHLFGPELQGPGQQGPGGQEPGGQRQGDQRQGGQAAGHGQDGHYTAQREEAEGPTQTPSSYTAAGFGSRGSTSGSTSAAGAAPPPRAPSLALDVLGLRQPGMDPRVRQQLVERYADVRTGVVRALRVSEQGAVECLRRAREVFDQVGERLEAEEARLRALPARASAGGQGARGEVYLVGGRFTAADLTFASMAALLVLPPQYGAYLPPLEDWPPSHPAHQLRATRAGRHALRMYELHRGGRAGAGPGAAGTGAQAAGEAGAGKGAGLRRVAPALPSSRL